MRQPTSILVYPVRRINNEWEYLLFHRVAHPKLGLTSFWQGVTGGLEDDETINLAAKRELLEETGILSSRIHPIDFSYSFPIQVEWLSLYAPGVKKITEHIFIAFIQANQEPILSGEHSTYKWCCKDEALDLLSYPGNIEGLKQCAIYLESHNISL